MSTKALARRPGMWCGALMFGLLLLGGMFLEGSQLAAQTAAEEESDRILTIDHQVPHVSTVPANAGKSVQLFVRESVASNKLPGKAVLMLHGVSVPVLAGYQLKHKHYDWSLELAKAGFDVFMLDFQGSGRSPIPDRDIRHCPEGTETCERVMHNPCNVPEADQKRALIPNPLPTTCPPSYPFQLINAQSDWDELDTVVEYIRRYRGVEKVALVGWSHASVRMGPYAVQHPEKVDSLFFLAPIFSNAIAAARQVGNTFLPPYKLAEDGSGRVIPCTPQELTAGTCPGNVAPSELLLSGTPMTLRTRADLMGTPLSLWDREIKCEGQAEEGIQDVVWSAIMENDALGRTWGPPPDSPAGVMRVRSFALWGWNSRTAARISVPVLLIGGEFDTQAPPASLSELYGAIPSDTRVPKLLFKVACAGHSMPWERQAKVLHQISKQWLKHGAVEGLTSGTFLVDAEGNLSPM
jgi:pimeloyl-ACP methyl ester carboxylesterase